MNTTNNTILITGGSAGIGLAMAKQFSAAGNHVIILGRNEERLQKAAAQLSNVTAIPCDVTKLPEVKKLVNRLKTEFPRLNVLINNAGSAYVYNLLHGDNTFEKASEEIMTNFLSVTGLTEQLLPLLKQQPEAAIVNVSSIVAFAPSVAIATYSASKAALHSYTQSLRYALAKDTAIKVFELMPPLVDTDFSKEIGGENGIKPDVVAAALITGMQQDVYELHVGDTAQIYQLSLKSPQDAFMAMNSRS